MFKAAAWSCVVALLCALCGCGGGLAADGGEAEDRGGGAPSDAGVAGDADAADGGGADIDTHYLDHWVEDAMAEVHIPGLSVAIVQGAKLCWTKGYGFAEIENAVAVTPDTLFMLASIAKTFIVTALMQVVEAGGLALDDDVNAHLPFAVENPNHTGVPITVRMLLTHTSGIRDNWTVIRSHYVDGDSTMALQEFLEGYLVPGGADYDAAKNFTADAPGAAKKYSNIGATLAAYMVERVTGTPFDAYCEARIFTPLKMTETSWHLAGLDPSHVAFPYMYDGNPPQSRRLEHYGYPDYPDGALRTSAPQLARLLMAYINKGELDGARVLKEETVASILQIQDEALDPIQGLIWNYDYTDDEEKVGHSGSDDGVSTTMYYRVSDGIGVIMLSNSDPNTAAALKFLDIRSRLFEDAVDLCR